MFNHLQACHGSHLVPQCKHLWPQGRWRLLDEDIFTYLYVLEMFSLQVEHQKTVSE